MDQMLLTGLVSCLFSSLASSPPEDSVTAPKLRLPRLSKGTRSETCASGATASPAAFSLGSAPGGPSSPQITRMLGLSDAAFVVAVLSSAAAAGPGTSANRAINANSNEQSFVVCLVCFIYYF